MSIRRNSYFPSQVVSDAEKISYEYGLKVARAIEREWFDGNRYSGFTNSFRNLRLYARGEQSIQKYKDELSINGDLSYLNFKQGYLNYNEVTVKYYNLLDGTIYGDYLLLLNDDNITNVNQIVDLKNKLNALTGPMTCEIIYNNTNKQSYTFINLNNSVQFYTGLRIIFVAAGNWKIKFNHDIHGYTSNNTIMPNVLTTSTLYVPSSAIGIVTEYDRSTYDGTTIINYKNNVIINTVTVDMKNISSEYYHLINVKKGNEILFVEYVYNVSIWIIKMPYNLPTKGISWERYYGNVLT